MKIVIVLLCLMLLAHGDNRTIIIKFSDKESRNKYLSMVTTQDDNFILTKIDNIFIGCICKHKTRSSYDRGIMILKKMMSNSSNKSIINYETDKVIAYADIQNNAPWHLDRIDQELLPLNNIYVNTPKNNVNIYVVDTGIKLSHNEFEGRASFGFSSIIDEIDEENDCHGHGTHVAGIIGGKISGVNKYAKLINVRVLDCLGFGTWGGVIKGLDWIKKNHKKPSIVNMSLGGGLSVLVNQAVKSLSDVGILVVVAAGNNIDNACNYSPASSQEALTVGATNENDQLSSFSNYGSCVNIYGPGENINSADFLNNIGFTRKSGTSMSSPIVAGVASLYVENDITYPLLFEKIIDHATNKVNSNIKPFVQVNNTKSEMKSICCITLSNKIIKIINNLENHINLVNDSINLITIKVNKFYEGINRIQNKSQELNNRINYYHNAAFNSEHKIRSLNISKKMNIFSVIMIITLITMIFIGMFIIGVILTI